MKSFELQETDLAAAAEKLAECQETIFLLGKQLKALHPQTEQNGSLHSERSPKAEGFPEDEPTISSPNLQELDQPELENATSAYMQKLGGGSPLHYSNALFSPSENEANHPDRSPVRPPKHRPTKSNSSSASSTPTPEKQARGFSRFFSPKAKNGH